MSVKHNIDSVAMSRKRQGSDAKMTKLTIITGNVRFYKCATKYILELTYEGIKY